jgi:hypothetical protein
MLQVFGAEFESDAAKEVSVLGIVHHTYTAATKSFEDAVVGDGLPDKRLGLRHLAHILGCRAAASQRRRTSQGQPTNTETLGRRGYKEATICLSQYVWRNTSA